MQNVCKIIILRGLPGSGKTVYAQQLVEQGYKRVSESDLRWSIDNGKWSNSNQLLLIDLQQIMVTILLQNNYSVVIDNCNLRPNDYKYARSLAKEYRADLEIVNFDIPLEICLERDLERTHGRIGKDAIVKLHKTYFINGQFPQDQ
jgi:predicted kinase